MTFLTPFLLAGLAALAVPVFVHLIQRERRNVVEFPSLMFVRRIPYQSTERRRIHNWGLLLLRLAALAAIVMAFARPFFRVDPVAAAASGDREVVILLDRSASMGHGDRWAQAQAAAAEVVNGLSGSDRATLVLFDGDPEETVRATSDQGTLLAAIDAASVSSGATRFAPALRLAQSRLNASGSSRREAVIVSDFQRTGWARQEDVQFPEGATITPVSVADDASGGVSVTSLSMERAPFSGAERVTITAGIANRAATPVDALPVALEIDGRVIERREVAIDANGTTAATFEAVTLAEANIPGVVRAGTDELPADNNFFFVLSPTRPLSVLVLHGDASSSAAARYLKTALDLGRAPAFASEVAPAARLTADMLTGRSLVVVDDATLGSAAAELLTGFVERGGGLMLMLGDRTPAGADWPLLPGTLSGAVDRTQLRGGTLGFLDYSHPVFDEFKDPRNGTFSNMRFLRYRGLTPAPDGRVLARFDDGAAAIVERRVGGGRVIAVTSSLDGNWSDAPRHAMYLPLVHELAAYLAQYEEAPPWQTVGRRFDISAAIGAVARDGQLAPGAPAGGVRGVVVSPSGAQTTLGTGGVESILLAEQGVYSVRLSGSGDRRPYAVAVNLAPEESDLASVPAEDMVAGLTGRSAPAAGAQALDVEPLTPVEMEKQQSVWWFLLVAGLVALLAEASLSNRLSTRVNALTDRPA